MMTMLIATHWMVSTHAYINLSNIKYWRLLDKNHSDNSQKVEKNIQTNRKQQQPRQRKPIFEHCWNDGWSKCKAWHWVIWLEIYRWTNKVESFVYLSCKHLWICARLSFNLFRWWKEQKYKSQRSREKILHRIRDAVLIFFGKIIFRQNSNIWTWADSRSISSNTKRIFRILNGERYCEMSFL